MRFLLAAAFTFSLTVSAQAQLFEPYATGDVIEKPMTVRCMTNETFESLTKTRHLHLIAMQVVKSNDKAIKTVSSDSTGDIVVANIMPDQKTVCILDILDDAMLSDELKGAPQ